jgi:hypothetical protein
LADDAKLSWKGGEQGFQWGLLSLLLASLLLFATTLLNRSDRSFLPPRTRLDPSRCSNRHQCHGFAAPSRSQWLRCGKPRRRRPAFSKVSRIRESIRHLVTAPVSGGPSVQPHASDDLNRGTWALDLRRGDVGAPFTDDSTFSLSRRQERQEYG